MASSAPQSVTPSVAFEIPIKKVSDGSSPPTVQQRLANSPRREISLEEINNKIFQANKRKEANALNSKTTTHNAKVASVKTFKKEEETDKSKALEEALSSKLANAEAKRDGMTNSWVQKLSASTRNKLMRGAKVREDVKWSAKELETKVDLKGLSADLRREELKLKTQEELAVSTNSKLRRGQLAMDLKGVESKKIENRSEQMILLAEGRRDNLIREQKEMLQKTATKKKEMVGGAIKQEEEEAMKLLAEIDEKIKLAEERKEKAIQGKVETLTSKIDSKMQRAADARRQEEERARNKEEHISKLSSLATERRDNIIRDQKEMLQQSAIKKENLILEKKRAKEKSSVQKEKDIHSKLTQAETRKDDILASKVHAARKDQQQKTERVKNTWISSLNESKELKQTSDERLKNAAMRKNKLMKDQLDEVQGVNKSKIDKVDKMNVGIEKKLAAADVGIEKKLAAASASRENNLVAKSSTKKRMLSPRSSPSDKKEIEARINEANLRREIYLTSKVEKAKNGKSSSPKINKALFTAVSPMRGGENNSSSRERISPRIKAARLEEFAHSNQEEDEGGHPRVLNMSLIAISGIAVVLVGFLSFLSKSK